MMNIKDQCLTLDKKEAAKRIGVSVATIEREIRRGRLPHVRVGRRVLLTEELLRQYLEKNTRAR